MELPWLQALEKLAEERPLVIIRFSQNKWESLNDSRRGIHEFTIARSHYLLEGVRAPAPCLIVGTDIDTFIPEPEPGAKNLYFGLISSRSAITTLESRLSLCSPGV